MRIALGLQYEGSSFAGWQSQPHGNTVQDTLERALARIAGEPLRVACAGRTDAGVHALEQVVHFDTTALRPLNAWVRGVNAFMPDAAAVQWATPVDGAFHARFSAQARTYRYVLRNHPVRPALHHHLVGWFHQPLDAERMRVAARYLVGEHDFSAFRAAGCQARSPVKTMYEATVARKGDYIVCDFRANAFLHHMVRNLMGALVYVGSGRQDPLWIAELLEHRDRRRAAATFSPAGLYLARIDYGERWRLPRPTLIMPPFPLPGAAGG